MTRPDRFSKELEELEGKRCNVKESEIIPKNAKYLLLTNAGRRRLLIEKSLEKRSMRKEI